MDKWEYEDLQFSLLSLISDEKLKSKGLNAKERAVYKKAVLACKSVLSNHNPAEKGETQ